jgi:hypothetical protein
MVSYINNKLSKYLLMHFELVISKIKFITPIGLNMNKSRPNLLSPYIKIIFFIWYLIIIVGYLINQYIYIRTIVETFIPYPNCPFGPFKNHLINKNLMGKDLNFIIFMFSSFYHR